MKLTSALSVTLALTTRMTAAVPVGMATDVSELTAGGPLTGAPEMTTTNVTNTASITSHSENPQPLREKELTGPLPLLISLIGGIIGPSLSGSVQNAVGELFKGGDLVLNGPLDIIEKLLHLNLPGAAGSLFNTIFGTLKGLPKDAVNIIGGGQKAGSFSAAPK
ncbi:hypothetical protein NQ176_g1953 [Zarea fungicola]|uniref:Uncharacterized protein n=1 Tax=Zarea fungicola TaxID=93591 RepID=A0ACC1NRL6_9HYPO|nr:hypothetical protein NQ176_g1953 [Lecanicillium fungicola]